MLISSKKKTFTATSRLMFDQVSGHCGLATLRHKINHHSNKITLNQAALLGGRTWILTHTKLGDCRAEHLPVQCLGRNCPNLKTPMLAGASFPLLSPCPQYHLPNTSAPSQPLSLQASSPKALGPVATQCAQRAWSPAG